MRMNIPRAPDVFGEVRSALLARVQPAQDVHLQAEKPFKAARAVSAHNDCGSNTCPLSVVTVTHELSGVLLLLPSRILGKLSGKGVQERPRMSPQLLTHDRPSILQDRGEKSLRIRNWKERLFHQTASAAMDLCHVLGTSMDAGRLLDAPAVRAYRTSCCCCVLLLLSITGKTLPAPSSTAAPGTLRETGLTSRADTRRRAPPQAAVAAPAIPRKATRCGFMPASWSCLCKAKGDANRHRRM